jgi:hypothetical protein
MSGTRQATPDGVHVQEGEFRFTRNFLSGSLGDNAEFSLGLGQSGFDI